MPDRCLLYCPDALNQPLEPDTPLHWLIIPGDTDASETGAGENPEYTFDWQQGRLADIPVPLTGYTHIQLVISSRDVTPVSTAVPSKQIKHLAQVLPYLVEEKLASDIESLHIAHTPPQRKGEFYDIHCFALAKAPFTQLLTQLKQAGLEPDGVSIDSLHLPTFDGGPTLFTDGDRCLLRQGYFGMSLDAGNLSIALDSLSQQSPFDTVYVYSDAAEDVGDEKDGTRRAPLALSLAGIQRPDRPPLATEKVGKHSLTNLIARTWLDAKPSINLLQGAFVPRRRNGSATLNWRPVAMVATILFALNLAYNLASGWYFNHQAEILYEQSEALYRELFPQDKRIVNLRRQAENHLAALTPQGKSRGFTELMGSLGKSWQGLSGAGLTIRQIRFDQSSGRMILDIEAPALNTLEQLQRQMRDAGLAVELLSADTAERGIRGRLQIARL